MLHLICLNKHKLISYTKHLRISWLAIAVYLYSFHTQHNIQGCGLDGISIKAEVKARPSHQGQGRGWIEAGLFALQQPTSFYFCTFFFGWSQSS